MDARSCWRLKGSKVSVMVLWCRWEDIGADWWRVVVARGWSESTWPLFLSRRVSWTEQGPPRRGIGSMGFRTIRHGSLGTIVFVVEKEAADLDASRIRTAYVSAGRQDFGDGGSRLCGYHKKVTWIITSSLGSGGVGLWFFYLRPRETFSLFSIAIRSVGSARTFHREISTVPSIIPRCSVLPPRPFSTATAMKLAADDSLVGVLENEITAAQEDLDNHQVGEVADGFPFEIVDSPGEQTILLKRKYDGETIQVVVDNPNVPFSEDNNEDDDDDDDDEAEEGDDTNNEDTGIPMVVNISKGNGQKLEFGLTAFADEICIDSFSIMEPGGSNSNAYEGPKFEDLDESLQKALVKYLEVRGIKTSTTKFLQEYMRSKDFREYLMWLKNLKGFVEQ